LTADALGVDPAALTDDVSLTDDLAADSLDVLELVMTIETEFAVSVPASVLADVRTYGDLVGVVADVAGYVRPVPLAVEPEAVRARVTPPGGRGAGVERAGRLTPYDAQTIVDDALYAGRGARLDVELPPGLTDAEVTSVADRFAELGSRGVDVHVRRRPPVSGMLWPRPPIAKTAS
jgi:acyl carrier protein